MSRLRPWARGTSRPSCARSVPSRRCGSSLTSARAGLGGSGKAARPSAARVSRTRPHRRPQTPAPRHGRTEPPGGSAGPSATPSGPDDAPGAPHRHALCSRGRLPGQGTAGLSRGSPNLWSLGPSRLRGVQAQWPLTCSRVQPGPPHPPTVRAIRGDPATRWPRPGCLGLGLAAAHACPRCVSGVPWPCQSRPDTRPPPAATPSPPAWPSAPSTGVLTGDRRSRRLALCERQLPPRRHLLGSCGVRVAPGEDVADRCGRVREPPQVVAGAALAGRTGRHGGVRAPPRSTTWPPWPPHTSSADP